MYECFVFMCVHVQCLCLVPEGLWVDVSHSVGVENGTGSPVRTVSAAHVYKGVVQKNLSSGPSLKE